MTALGLLGSLIAVIAGIVGYLATGNIALLLLVAVGVLGCSAGFVVGRGGPRRR